jgi:hypothetical protein
MPVDEPEVWSTSAFYEFTIQPTEWKREPPTAKQLLRMMRSRVEVYGAPLPDGFVPPPGIDLDALLKEVPWPPPATNG